MLFNVFHDAVYDLGVQIFEGTSEQTKKYLRAHPDLHTNNNITVQHGRSSETRSVKDYLEGR